MLATHRFIRRYLLPALLMLAPVLCTACDLCGCFMPQDLPRGLQLGVAEQYSSFSELSLDGHQLPNALNQYLHSSYTQILANYRINERLSLQLSVPFIYRSYRRPAGDALQTGTESGLGDLLLLGTYAPFQRKNPMAEFHWKLLGGLKFPTGNSDPIAEELDEGTESPAAGIPSGVHGHDIALGSGSWDGVIGTSVTGRQNRWFYAANVQYAIRTTGSFDYKYANDLLFYGGPGYYAVAKGDRSLGLQALLSGEHKGEDRLAGESADDTALTAIYLGPNALLGIGPTVMAEIGAGFPLSIDNSGLQNVPRYRFRFSFTWHIR